MAKTKKWSEQILVEKSFVTQDENGNEVKNQYNVLEVCIGGLPLFNKEFVNGKYKGKNQFLVPYDFIVLAGSECPKGKFYEMEYFIGDGGLVYRALLQMVNPVEDVRTILATLKRKNILPNEFKAEGVWYRSDIDKVHIGYCSKDEDGPSFTGGIVDAKDGEKSIGDYVKGMPSLGACLEYYRGDCREVWVEEKDVNGFDKVFVCASDNVNDPEFADKKAADMEELEELMEGVLSLVRIYGLQHFIAVEMPTEDDSEHITIAADCKGEFLRKVFEVMEGGK